MMTPEMFESRFGHRTDRSGTCWVWMGARTSRGYGCVRIGGCHGHTVGLHILAYETFIGPVRPGMSVCHTCDNPACWRPAHLFEGTHQDNHTDKVRKGRGLKRLTREQVTEIRARYQARSRLGLGRHWGRDSIRALARAYNVSPRCIVWHVSQRTDTELAHSGAAR
jgi:hypothetical protein